MAGDGNHRLDAARALGLAEVPVAVDGSWSKNALPDDFQFPGLREAALPLQTRDTEAISRNAPAYWAELRGKSISTLTLVKYNPDEERGADGRWGGDITQHPDYDATRVKQWGKQPVGKLRAYLNDPRYTNDTVNIQAALDKKTGAGKPSANYGQSVKDPVAWGAQHNGDWEKRMTTDETKSLRAYADTSFSERINPELRGGKSISAGDQAKMTSLDSALAKAEPLSSDTRVYRGLSSVPDSWRVGSVVKDAGYMSTTVDRDTALRNFGGQILMDIRAPAGMQAGYMNDVLSAKHSNESELLFPRGTSVKITNISIGSGSGGGKAVIYHGVMVPSE
jgi:hypothetical protein